MPTLQLKISPPQHPVLYADLARELTAITAELLGKRPEVTAVMVEELPAARWYVDSTPVQRATAWLEISITAGTNTAVQKAAFINAAFACLQDLLGGGQVLESASYVIVRELRASDWGYGGLTQETRRQAAQVEGR